MQYVNTFFNIVLCFGTGREARTPDTWFWRPVLYQLSYSRKKVPAAHLVAGTCIIIASD